MIVEGLVGLFFDMLSLAFRGMEIVGLPFQLISVLQTILCYGVWIVGADIMAIFVSLVVGWWAVKFSVGLLVWLWELLPLT